MKQLVEGTCLPLEAMCLATDVANEVGHRPKERSRPGVLAYSTHLPDSVPLFPVLSYALDRLTNALPLAQVFKNDMPSTRFPTSCVFGLRLTAKKFALVSLSPATISLFFCLSGCLLVEFWWCFWRRATSHVHVWALGRRVKFPHCRWEDWGCGVRVK